MSKITEEQHRRQTLSAQDQYDEIFNNGLSPEFIKEAVLIEKEIQTISNIPEWEPTEEKFQILLQKARKKGLVSEGEHLESNTEKKKHNLAEKRHQEHKHKAHSRKRRVITGSIITVFIMLMVFGIFASSKSNRVHSNSFKWNYENICY